MTTPVTVNVHLCSYMAENITYGTNAYDLMFTYGLHPMAHTVYEPYALTFENRQFRFADRFDKTSIWIEFNGMEMPEERY